MIRISTISLAKHRIVTWAVQDQSLHIEYYIATLKLHNTHKEIHDTRDHSLHIISLLQWYLKTNLLKRPDMTNWCPAHYLQFTQHYYLHESSTTTFHNNIICNPNQAHSRDQVPWFPRSIPEIYFCDLFPLLTRQKFHSPSLTLVSPWTALYAPHNYSPCILHHVTARMAGCDGCISDPIYVTHYF